MDYNNNFQKYKDEKLDLSFDKDFEKYGCCKPEPPKPHCEESYCGEITIKCKNVYINIVCDQEKKCDC